MQGFFATLWFYRQSNEWVSLARLNCHQLVNSTMLEWPAAARGHVIVAELFLIFDFVILWCFFLIRLLVYLQ